jgi:hypothetical protein
MWRTDMLSDIWRFSKTTRQFTRIGGVDTVGNTPPSDVFPGSVTGAFDWQIGDKKYLFGGWNRVLLAQNSLWELQVAGDVSSATFVPIKLNATTNFGTPEVEDATNWPDTLYSGSVAADPASGKAWLFGGVVINPAVDHFWQVRFVPCGTELCIIEGSISVNSSFTVTSQQLFIVGSAPSTQIYPWSVVYCLLPLITDEFLFCLARKPYHRFECYV